MRTRAQDQLDGAPDPPRAARHKRRRSTSASLEETQASQEPSSTSYRLRSSSPAGSDGQPKSRKKRAKRTSRATSNEPSEEVVASPALSQEAPPENASLESQSRASKRVRFSDPGPNLLSETATTSHADSDLPLLSHAPESTDQLLPSSHPSKTARSGRQGRRTSLPASFPDTPGYAPVIEELQFSPLRAVLDNRVRRRLRRSHLSEEVNQIEQRKREDAQKDARLQKLQQEVKEFEAREKELMLELEVQRQMSIEVHNDKEEDDRVREMQEELTRLRKQITDRQDQGVLSDIDEDPDEDMLLDPPYADEDMDLIVPEDINISREDMIPARDVSEESSTHATRTIASHELSESSTQVSLPDPGREHEVRRFEETITTLSREANDAKTLLEILTIELQSLGFTSEDADPLTVLHAIRTAFQNARITLDELLSDQMPSNVQNEAFLESLIQQIGSLLTNIDAKEKSIARHIELETLLKSQNKGLLDKLAELDARRQTLEKQWNELDRDAEKKTKELVDLTEQNEGLAEELEEHIQELVQKDAAYVTLQGSFSDRTLQVQDLEKTLEGCREEISGLGALISKMEEEHKAKVARLDQDYTAQVAELEAKLYAEERHRKIAEDDATQKDKFISELEIKVDAAETELRGLSEELSQFKELAQSEKQQREAAEQEVDQQKATIGELEVQVERATTTLDQLREDIQSVRTLAEAERCQRETAELELDTTQKKVTELEAKIQAAGVEANDLRQKIFELQVRKDAIIAEMTRIEKEREERYQLDMTAEIERRETAERTITDKEAIIKELEENLRLTEEAMDALTKEKIATIAERDARVAELEEALQALQTEHETYLDTTTKQIEDLTSEITNLKDTLAMRVKEIETLRSEATVQLQAHAIALADRDSQITQLSDELAAANAAIDDLESTKTNLQQRIADETEHMLNMQDQHIEEVAVLKQGISARDSQMDEMRRENVALVEGHKRVVSEKDEQIKALTAVVDSRNVEVQVLLERQAYAQQKNRELVQASKKALAAANNHYQSAVEHAMTIEQQFHDSSADLMEDVEATFKAPIPYPQNGPIKHSVKIIKRKKVKRNFDSGIGVAEDEETGSEESVSVKSARLSESFGA